MDDPLAYASELASRDEELARAIAELARAQERTDAVRAGAEEVEGFLRRLPAERELADAALAQARQKLARRREEAALARRRVDAAAGRRGAEERADAGRALALAEDAERAARRAVERLEGERTDLERRAVEVDTRAGALAREAAEVAAELRRLPRVSEAGGAEPGTGSGALLEWASRARAALFVVRGGLDREREALLRQANELAAAAFGEPLSATNVRLVAERLRRERS